MMIGADCLVLIEDQVQCAEKCLDYGPESSVRFSG